MPEGVGEKSQIILREAPHHQPISGDIPHCWGTGLPYGLHIRITSHNPPCGPSVTTGPVYQKKVGIKHNINNIGIKLK
jgi:hypothetical protein